MKKIWIIARHEFFSTLKRRSALFVIFGLPLLTILLFTGLNALIRTQSGPDGGDERIAAAGEMVRSFISDEEPGERERPMGLVDETGRLAPLSHPADTMFAPFPSLEAARAAYEAGEIRGYYRAPADYLETGRLFFYADAFSFQFAHRQMLYQLLAEGYGVETAVVSRLVQPWSMLTEVDLSSGQETERNPAEGLLVGLGVAVLFYLTAMGASGYLLQSLGKEKENRVLEILIASTRPLHLLLGKVIGLGVVGLLQMGVWSAVFLPLWRGRDSALLQALPRPALAPLDWLLIILHFLVGYLVYASLLAGLGAAAPGPKESSQYSLLVMAPSFIPFFFSGVLIASPNDPWGVVLSLFPLTAPIAMPMRLAVTAVPPWQWLASLGVGMATAVAIMALAARLFRSRVLLSGGLTLRQIWTALRR